MPVIGVPHHSAQAVQPGWPRAGDGGRRLRPWRQTAPTRSGRARSLKPWPAITRGIWGDPDRYLATYWSRWPDVWVHGDWASIDDDGDWFLHGRSDDTIKVAGKRLGPAEIESILAEHSAVAESAAVGFPDSIKGEVILCFVVLSPGHEPTNSTSSRIWSPRSLACSASRSRPHDVRFVAELPQNPKR